MAGRLEVEKLQENLENREKRNQKRNWRRKNLAKTKIEENVGKMGKLERLERFVVVEIVGIEPVALGDVGRIRVVLVVGEVEGEGLKVL
jgi:hypothetical protein